MSDSYRYGISVPDEDPPGNQVTTRVQKFPLLSHRQQRLARMLTPRSIPGEFVSPRILRHAPSCYILVTMRALDAGDSARFIGSSLASACFSSDGVPSSPPAQVTQAVGQHDDKSKRRTNEPN